MIPSGGNAKQSFPMDNSILHRISPGPSRVLVGVNQFNDENQQNLRIQQAVNRYNGTGLPPYWRPSATFKCNLFKGKILKPFVSDDTVSCEDAKQKPETRYASPGHFPTVLLGKHQTRPSTKQSILSQLRSNASGLPVSRFLDDSAEKYSDTKPTRSVLEVLQDLSRKRIHGKDDCEDSSKRRCKGLGGDLVAEGDIPFQPLFVSKQKNQIFPKKDQMTQTLSDLNLIDNNKISSAQDSKWELRKKLAQKNNEIFASLSSSIAGAFFAKRKRAGNSNVPDVEEKSIKKKKVEIPMEFADKVKPIDHEKKLIRKEPGPRSPPTKDKLMNIYFDLQNNSNFKGEVLKAMKSENSHSQFQRQVGNDDKNVDAPTTNDSIINTASLTTPNKGEISFKIMPLNETSPIPITSHVQTSLPEKDANDIKKPALNVVQPFVQLDSKLNKSEKLSLVGEVTTTSSLPITNSSIFSSSPLTNLQKDNKSSVVSPVPSLTFPKINLGGDQETFISKSVKTDTDLNRSATSTSFLEGTQSDEKDFKSPKPLKDAFQLNAEKNASVNNFNLGISTSIKDAFKINAEQNASTYNFNVGPPKSDNSNPSANLNDIKPAETKLGFSFGDSKSAMSTPTFSFNATKSTPSPSSSFGQIGQNIPPRLGEVSTDTIAPSAIDAHSSPAKKPADTTSTFSFGSIKPTSSPSVAPSLFPSLQQKSTSVVTSTATSSTPTPLFSFGKSSTELGAKAGFFSFGSDSEKGGVNVGSVEAMKSTANKPSESFSFGNVVSPVSSLNSTSDAFKSNSPEINNIKRTLPTSGIFPTALPVTQPKNNLTTSENTTNIFSRLGGVVEKSEETPNILKPNEIKAENIAEVGTEQSKAKIFDLSKAPNENILFTGGSLFGSELITKTTTNNFSTTHSGPLFTQTSSPVATSSVFNSKPIDQPSFKFGPDASATSNSSETKAFVFGPTSNVIPGSDDKSNTKINDSISTKTPSSIFSFGPEKQTNATPNFTFGKLPSGPSTQPFSFGKTQAEAISSTTNSSTFPTTISSDTSKTIVGFNMSQTSQCLTGNQTTAPVSTAPTFGGTTSTFSFGSTNSTPFGTTNNLFGATTSSNSVFGQTTPAFGTATTTPSTFGNGTFNTTTSTPITFGSGTAFGSTTSAPTTFSISTASAPTTFGSSTTFGNATSGSASFGNTNTAFGATTTPSPSFGSGTSFGATTSASLAFGSGTSFGAATSAPTTFGSGTSFGTTPSGPTFGNANTFGTTTSNSLAFGNPTSFGSNTTASTAFGVSSAFTTTTSTPSTFGSLTSFGSASSPNSVTNASSAFGNPTAPASFGNSNSASPFATANNTFGTSQLPTFGNTGTAFNSNAVGFGNSVNSPAFGNASPAFNSNTPFGNGNASGNNNSAFGSNVSTTTASPTPFGNANPTPTTFGFGSGSTTTNSTIPSFNFGSTPTPSNQANNSFNFGSASTAGSSASSVFNFGGNSAGGNSKPFCFGSNTSGASGFSQPTPGPSGFPSSSTPFNATPNLNQSTSFSLPGTFSIGSGSTQPRSRTGGRFRRRT